MWRTVMKLVIGGDGKIPFSLLSMNVYLTREIPDEILANLGGLADVTAWDGDAPVPRDVLLDQVGDAHGLLCMLTDRIDTQVLDAAPDLEVVSQMAVGVDNIDVDACMARGIRIGHTPDVLTDSVADHALALLLAAARRLPEGRMEVVEGRWGPWDPWAGLGVDVGGTTLGIVGMGRVGNAVAHRAHGFGIDVIYASRSASGEIGSRVDLDELLDRSDHVVLTVPLTPETRHLVDAAALARMRETAVLVNVARGPVIDQGALYDALVAGSIFAAALDVTDPEPLPPDHPLLTLNNCLVVPHIGSATRRTRNAMAQLAVDNLVAHIEGRPMPAELAR